MLKQIPVPVDSEGSDGKLVADFVPPKGRWTLGDMETDFPLSLLHTSIAAIILQPEPGEPPFTGLCWRMKVRVESAPAPGDHKGRPYYATMLRLRKPVRAWWQRNVSFPSPGHFTLCVIRQQSLQWRREISRTRFTNGPAHSLSGTRHALLCLYLFLEQMLQLVGLIDSDQGVNKFVKLTIEHTG